MSVPGQAWVVNPVKVRTEQRLATSSELNPAGREVTNCMEPGGRRCRAATQVKGLSPERTNVENRPTRFISWQVVANLVLEVLGTGYGRDNVTLADERASQQGTQTSTCSYCTYASLASQADAPGSKTVARHHKHSSGTWEIQAVAIRWQGPDNLKRKGRTDGSLEVGPTHSRGVAGVMPGERAFALEGAGNHLYRKGGYISHTQRW